MGKKVAVFGAGMGGLCVAHELVKHGFEVDVYESAPDAGGKAKSQYVPGPAGSRFDGKRFPGEHGFRFYPHFYRHLIATMREIPFSREYAESIGRNPSSDGTVCGNLTESDQAAVAAGDLEILPRRFHDGDDLVTMLRTLFGGRHMHESDLAIYGWFLTRFLTSCHERREAECDLLTWWQYIEADRWYTPGFRNLLAGVPRTMVAMHANKGSARTIGGISAQLMFDFTPGRKDATMTGPTNETWLVPWRLHLERQNVRLHFGHALARFDFDGAAISGARVRGPQGETRVVADYYVSAMPLEKMQDLVNAAPELAEFDESLARVARLAEATEWMVGAQFYLRKDIGICRGHTFYPLAPWGLTTISQAQFWERLMKRPVAEHFGISDLRGVLSVDISDWTQPDACGKTARDCQSRDELLDEVWKQLKAGLKDSGAGLADEDVIFRHLDANVTFEPDPARPGRMCPRNETPLLIHPPGSHALRPDAAVRIPNLLLASDYVRTYTDLASMEGANEAGRRAVRAILWREGLDPESCPIWPLREGAFEHGQAVDRVAFRSGRAHVMDTAAFVPAVANQAFGVGQSILDMVGAPRLFGDALTGIVKTAQHAISIAPGLPGLSGQLGLDALGQWVTFLTRRA